MIASLSNVENGISVGTRPRPYPEGAILLRIKFRVGYGTPAVAEIEGFTKLSSLRYWANPQNRNLAPNTITRISNCP